MRIKQETKDELDKLKIHPRESYDEVISMLLRDRKPVYDKDFRKWLLDCMMEHYLEEFGILHMTDCDMGLQVFCAKSDIILIPHMELKMLKCIMDEGFDAFSKDGHSLFKFKIFQTIDGKLR